ncbi:MAG: hypothetical protein IKL24_00225 [Clostridia bacterium]|nr:hypothetical protein [Clostridia bacterium]
MKKKLLTAALLTVTALTLVVATVFVTIAYMTSSTAVSNTFTVGDVKIEMFESKVNSDGVRVDAGGNPLAEGADIVKDADGNSYHLKPGKSYIKDPTIYINSTSDDCYLFIKTRNQIAEIEDGNNVPDGADKDADALTMREQLLANGWVLLYETDGGEVIYCYKGSGALTSDIIATPVAVDKTPGNKTAIDLFENFTVDVDADVSRSGGAKVTITAFAIQNDGFSGAISETVGTKAFMMRLWNIVSGEFTFENVVIPEADIQGTALNP